MVKDHVLLSAQMDNMKMKQTEFVNLVTNLVELVTEKDLVSITNVHHVLPMMIVLVVWLVIHSYTDVSMKNLSVTDLLLD